MPVRLETIVDGFDQAAGPWQTILNGTPVPPYNNTYGTWGNLPGGASVGGFFQNHERRRIVKIGMQWDAGGFDGDGFPLQFYHNPSGGQYDGPWEVYAPDGDGIDLKAMGLFGDGVYREYVLPTPYPARGVLWFKGFDDFRLPLNGTLYKIRIFTDDWTPSSAAQGTVRTLDSFGAGQPPITEGTSGAWEIMREDYSVVAYRANPQGWNVAWDRTRLVVKRPLTADQSQNYLVRFRE